MAGVLLDNKGKGKVKWQWPSIHPEGFKFGIFAIVASLVPMFWLDWATLGWPMLFLSLGVFAFFRDPERAVPLDDELIVAPADGLVTMISKVEPPAELLAADGSKFPTMTGGERIRVSIFMSVFDVHINRTPISGTVDRVVYIPGKFLNADLDKASEDNERQHFLVTRPDGIQVAFTQIAGLIARRIVPFVKPGDIVGVGQRVGLIRFGSRVDVYLPVGTGAKVLMGQKVVAGETILAEIGVDEEKTGRSH